MKFMYFINNYMPTFKIVDNIANLEKYGKILQKLDVQNCLKLKLLELYLNS